MMPKNKVTRLPDPLSTQRHSGEVLSLDLFEQNVFMYTMLCMRFSNVHEGRGVHELRMQQERGRDQSVLRDWRLRNSDQSPSRIFEGGVQIPPLP